MEITSKLLLSSAQNFINKKEINRTGEENNEIKKLDNHREIENKEISFDKLIKSTENLKKIQYEYTKEQMRLKFLNDSFENIQPNLKFGNELLFPELVNQVKINREELKEEILKKLEHLKYKLKQIQIEQENFFAANFISAENLNLENLKTNISNIDPQRVSKLTRFEFLG